MTAKKVYILDSGSLVIDRSEVLWHLDVGTNRRRHSPRGRLPGLRGGGLDNRPAASSRRRPHQKLM
jgi:hypothetical protein